MPKAPGITKAKPASDKRGTLVTISGTNSGTRWGTSAVRFGATKCAAYISWNATRIKCKLPAAATKAPPGASGAPPVRRPAGRSAATPPALRR